jgi:hypothetical protein
MDIEELRKWRSDDQNTAIKGKFRDEPRGLESNLDPEYEPSQKDKIRPSYKIEREYYICI